MNKPHAATILVALTIAARVSSAGTDAAPGEDARTVEVRASTKYDRNGLWRAVLGDDWRDVWSAPITVPVLDLGRYAGGLTPTRSGGNQSKTLRFEGADGRLYGFRSSAKRIRQTMKVPGNALVQDQAAVFHPTGLLVVTALQDAVGLLQSTPELVYIPDDPRLGKFRKEFANTLGIIELRPDEYKNGTAFANAEKICDTETLLDNLEESSKNRLDSREYLIARLMDFLLGDTDRGADQWRFAKFKRGDVNLYRPIVRDRDYAFLKVEGLLALIGPTFDPRAVAFNKNYPSLRALCFTTREFDRSHLVELEWPEWEAIIGKMERDLSDDVIDRAVKRLPEAHYELSGAEIAAGLKVRRNALRALAREYYLMINEEADVFGSDDPEQVAIDRHEDGSVSVRMWRVRDGRKPDAIPVAAGGDGARTVTAPVFERRFVPDETHEIRVYLERGDDHAVVRGSAPRTIPVRVTGGEGNDQLEDSSRSGDRVVTRFHDASGDNTFERGPTTGVSTRTFFTEPPVHWEEDGKAREKTRLIREERRGRMRDLLKRSDNLIDPDSGERFAGDNSRWLPMTGYRESGGVLLGYGPAQMQYDFRCRPYEWSGAVQGIVGTRTGELGVQLTADRYFENSDWSFALFAHATNLESNRFYGYGNDTPLLDSDLTLIERFEVLVRPSVRWEFAKHTAIELGPVVRYVDPQLAANSPATVAAPPGTEPFGQAGARADLSIDLARVEEKHQSGVGFDTGVSAYPALWDVNDPFGEAHAVARAYIPLGWPTLALRAGGQRNWGTFPLHESAFIGGRWTVRGFRWNRFAGDTSAYGTAELRVPVAHFGSQQLGVIGFGDAGRVWSDDRSPGDWHLGAGGGAWFGTPKRQASVAYAKGDEHRVYFYFGLPF